jgi:hypothetical protein
MLECTAHYREFLDERGRRYVVRLSVGMRVGVVIFGPREESIEWRGEWGRYAPQAEATAAALVEEFQRRLTQGCGAEQANAELLHPAAVRVACKACADDRQLPAGDRA